MIVIDNLQFAYKKANILDGLHLQWPTGYIYGLLGGNGQGKSTLFKNICGLLFPNSGNISVFGSTPELRNTQFLQTIYLLPEEMESVDLTPGKYVKYYAKFYPNFKEEQLLHYMNEFEVPKSQRLSSMSLGQKKKFYISFALACNCAVLLMDEPTNGLDIISKATFRKLMAGYVNENNMVVISTHQVRDLEQLIDRVAVLDNGKIIFDYSLERIANKLFFGYGGTDYLYEESGLQGTYGIAKNRENILGKVDMELLYKALQSKHSELLEIMEGETSNA